MRRSAAVAVAGAGLLMAALLAARPSVASGQEPVTIGLALSGGSAKGIAHVGVLRTLERLGVDVDVVAGTSMGGVIGGMYAIGLSVDSIESVMRGADWASLLTDATPRERRSLEQRRLDERAILSVPLEGARVTLPSGAIVGSNALRLLEHVLWRGGLVRRFQDLPRPFGAVATDLETGEPVRLREGALAESLRASAGLPGAVEPLMLDRRLLVDGAMSRNLPAVDARELGADFVICSDVSEPIDAAEDLRSFVDVLSQLASLSMLESTLEQRSLCDVLVLPDVDGLTSFDFDRVDEWVARGEAATLAHEAQLAALAGRTRRERSGASPALLGDSIRITGISIAGSSDLRMVELIRRELELDVGDFVGRDQMEARLSDLESTGLFGLVRYRLDERPDGAALTVSVEERPRDRLGVGLRYDDERRAALLFTATQHNLLLHGSVTRFDLRVGEETRIGASLRRRRGLTGRLGVGVAAQWSQAPIRLPAAEGGGKLDVDLWSASLSLGLVAWRSTYVGLEGGVERAEAVSDAVSAQVASAALVLDHETLDRIDFPRSGADVSARAEWGVSDLSPGGEYELATADARAFVSLARWLTVDAGVFVGYTQGRDLPAHERLFLGGSHPSAVFRATQPTFQGLGSQEHMGRAVQVARLGIRLEAATDWFLRAGVDVGAARDEWRLPLARPMTGWALAGGFRSRIGPVLGQVSKVWGTRHDPRVSVSVGRSF